MIKKIEYIKKNSTKTIMIFIGIVILILFLKIHEVNAAGVLQESDIQLKMHVIDVGHGLALLFETDGHYLLYDGGDRDYSSKVVSYLRRQGVEVLDAIVVSHYDADHLNGVVGALNVFKVINVIAPDYEEDTKVYESFLNILNEKELQIISPSVGEQYFLGNILITVLAPNSPEYTNVNDYSIVLRFEYEDTSIIVSGDATKLSEQEMLSNELLLESDIMVLGHHGSGDATSIEYFNEVSPSVVVISCESEGQYNHPAEQVLQILEKNNVQILRTDKLGDFAITVDGANIVSSVDSYNKYLHEERRLNNSEAAIISEENAVKEITYILNNNSKKFHYVSCYSIEKIAIHNYEESYEEREVLIRKGYSSCGNCNP